MLLPKWLIETKGLETANCRTRKALAFDVVSHQVASWPLEKLGPDYTIENGLQTKVARLAKLVRLTGVTESVIESDQLQFARNVPCTT